MLVSARGTRWKKVHLAMFTVYVDDSGTDPNQAVAIASAWVIPGPQIIRLESEWDTCNKPLTRHAEIAWTDFDSTPDPNWREALTVRKSELERWANDPDAIAHTQDFFRKWVEKKAYP